MATYRNTKTLAGPAHRGVLFSLMVFLLVGALLSIQQASSKKELSADSALTESAVFRKVSDKFSNVYNETAVLPLNPVETGIGERVLPFTYTADGNSLTVTADVPIQQNAIDEYLESLNGIKVFLEDTNYRNQYDSMPVDMNTLLPVTWGATPQPLHFITQPQCMQVTVADNNTLEFRMNCSYYNYFSVRRRDVNVMPQSLHDFNSVSCNFNGSTSCPNNAFDANNTLPYFSVTIVDANCSKCNISPKSISGHFDPSVPSTVKLACTGQACTSPELDLNFQGETEVHFTGQQLPISVNTDFNTPVTTFTFNDVNVSVTNQYFGVRIWN